MEKRIDGTHYLLMYLTGFGFYTYQVYVQLLYASYGLRLVIPFIIAFLLMPLSILYVCIKFNKKPRLNPKTNLIFNVLSILYLIITSLLTINYASVMVHNYYYQSTKSYIISFFFIIPVIYVCFKSSKTYYSLAFIIFLIFLLFNFFYTINQEVTDFYPLYNTLFIDKPWLITFLALVIFIEPVIVLSNNNFIDKEKKINTKFILIVSILISLLAIYTIIRQSMEFGLLIESISFPYFESGKFMSIKSNFDNIDYYYLLLITVGLFARVPMLFFNIKDTFSLKTKGILICFATTIVANYYIQKRLEFYREILTPALIIATSILIILTILSFFNKRGENHAQ